MVYLLNQILRLTNRKHYQGFLKGMNTYMDTQRTYLLDCLKKNEKTTYGKTYDFAGIHSIEDYRQKVPLTSYEDYIPHVNDIMETGGPVLVEEPILLMELSSGSTSASKHIPYTKGLKTDFMMGIKPWLYDLYSRRSKLLKGRAYWSISPVKARGAKTKSGITIGFEEDTGYFDWIQTMLFNRLFVVPSDIKQVTNIEDFRYVTMAYLVREKNLSLISVWNPSFLSLLLDCFVAYKEEIIRDIEVGVLNVPSGNPLPVRIIKGFKKDKKRANHLRNITQSDVDFSKIWPIMDTISCWDQGNSEGLALKLNDFFTQVTIQGKGLLATECLVTIPFIGIGHIVAYQSHFFEFMDFETGDLLLLNELICYRRYTVIVTTRGGLYRYQLHDLVEVVGFYVKIPLLKFISKSEHILDFFGEKLHGHHVKEALDQLELPSDFYFLAPIEDTLGFRYCLYIEAQQHHQSIEIQTVLQRLEAMLCENFHYEYARHLKQIGHVGCYIMNFGAKKAYYDYLDNNEGMKLGDIKYQVIHKQINLKDFVEGYLIDFSNQDSN